MDYLANNIKYLRKKRGIKQKVMAKDIHVCFRTVQSWESGVSAPTLACLILLEKELQIDLNSLVHKNLEEEDEKNTV